MQRHALLCQRLLALFLAALLALFSPLVLRFEGAPPWQGIPALYVYLFGAWAGVIAAAAWIVTRSRD